MPAPKGPYLLGGVEPICGGAVPPMFIDIALYKSVCEPERLTLGVSPVTLPNGPDSTPAPCPVAACSLSSPATKLVKRLKRLLDTLSDEILGIQAEEEPV